MKEMGAYGEGATSEGPERQETGFDLRKYFLRVELSDNG